MDGVSDHQQQNFQSAHQLYLATKRSFRNLDIPPRKLLTHRLAALSSEPSMQMYHHNIHHQQNDSPRVLPEETLYQKFLPNSNLDDDSDPYASDEFRMYEFKIRKCTRSRSHDWTDCPFAHPGEKARRRCVRRFNYSGDVCPEFRSRGSCIRGDTCEFAHGVFECWLHPSRYRTEACKDGKDCQRKICFFAHTPSQLRSPLPMVSPNKHVNAGHCPYCRCHPGIHHTTSPTSILDMDVLSPPYSPLERFSPAHQLGSGFSPVSRFCDRLSRAESHDVAQFGNANAGYKDFKNGLMNPQAIEEVMHSMKVMNINAVNQQGPNLNNPCGSSRVLSGECSYPMNTRNESSTSGPDFEWVNDLLT